MDKVELRGCLKSSGCREPTQHQTQARHREVNHRLTALGQAFRVFAQAARLVEPRQRAFDHPPTRQQHKAFGAFRTQRDTEDEAPMLVDPCDQLPPIASIDPEPSQLFAGVAEPCEEAAGSRRVGDRGRRDAHCHQEPQRIHQQMACASLDIFAFIVAVFSPKCGGCDAWAVEAAGRGMFRAPGLLTHVGAPGVVETRPVSTGVPLTKIPLYDRIFSIIMRQHPPLDAPVDDRKESIDYRPHLQLAGAPARFGRWDQHFEKIPCGLSQV